MHLRCMPCVLKEVQKNIQISTEHVAKNMQIIFYALQLYSVAKDKCRGTIDNPFQSTSKYLYFNVLMQYLYIQEWKSQFIITMKLMNVSTYRPCFESPVKNLWLS
jgi:hypothetical protein